ncbi:MAG: hypothetical protein HYT65_00740 [Candidatus Yanofskybacteria bacterium]|nr:hypothetical protein [Candidatus Yanofskybacteria bacterium]
MHQGKARGSQLIIYPDGTLYHIDLKKSDNIPPNIFLVGAAGRVNAIAKHFDSIQFGHQNKERPEFYIVCGTYRGVPMAAMSHGIGVANIEIALTELHALFEFDCEKNKWSDTSARVNLIRVGTAGAVLEEIPLGTLAISRFSLGLDNLGVFYPPKYSSVDMVKENIDALFWRARQKANSTHYVSTANPEVVEALQDAVSRTGEAESLAACGISVASPGFFGPEGRRIGRISTAFTQSEFLEAMIKLEINGFRVVNIEMETSVLFRLANEMLGYRAGAICTVLDNLVSDQMIDAAYAAERIERCILVALEAMVELANNP